MENLNNFLPKKVDIANLTKYLVKKYNLELLVLFGSCQTNKLWQGSDFDIGFWSNHRFMMDELEGFIVDIMLLSDFDTVNAIDLYFDTEQRLDELKGSRYGTELSLLQYVIYTTGRLLHENEWGLFANKKNQAANLFKFQNRDIKKLIINDKLESIKKLLENLDNVIDYYDKEDVKILGYEKKMQLDSYLSSAQIKIVLDIINTAVKLNRFILNEYCNFNPHNSYESFTKLEMIKIFTREDIEIIKSDARIVAFYNFLTIDYYYGYRWSTDQAIATARGFFPKYIEIMKKLL